MVERLFLYAGFSGFCVGWAKKEVWRYEQCGMEPITDCLFSVLRPCMDGISLENAEIYLINGPGSTLGIRTFCAFVRTLLVLKKVKPSQVFVCDALHFAQRVLTNRNLRTPLCARLNMTQVLGLNAPDDTLHIPSEAEKKQALWLPHPCLAGGMPIFCFEMKEVLPLLLPQSPWQTTNAPDVFQAPN